MRQRGRLWEADKNAGCRMTAKLRLLPKGWGVGDT